MPITLEQPDAGKITVIVRKSERQKDGKLKYETAGSFNVTGGSPEQVLALLRRAVTATPKE